ncbi:M20/M25/M40 family metallo-hydrolase [Natroniella sp. ANB-PHB2]|uniref:M20/M25/M40 family metallo-hydrolase n=1 Tax=Natroniella sp. ANB-PHB2 TaxID=3384444 RepID=UPI0038D4258B
MSCEEEIFQFIDSNLDRFIEETIMIQQIPAPTFQEEDRAAYIKERFELLGQAKVDKDKVGNVINSYIINEDLPTVMITAHLDTVFSKEVDLEVKRERDKVSGPGLCDNSLGLKGLLVLAEIINKFEVELNYNLILAATVGEESKGNLKGMSQLMESYQHQVDTVIVLEGNGLGRITHQAVGSSRWRVKFSALGGHSWSDFGNSSAIHTMAKVISNLANFELPTDPQTTFNIGKVTGGQTVNTIAATAQMLLEVRSLSKDLLIEIDQDFRETIQNISQQDKVEVNFEDLGTRPAGRLNREDPLVNFLVRVHQKLDISSNFKPASTEANLPLNLGIPAVTIGLTEAANLHSTAEYIEVGPVKKGLQQLVLIIIQIDNYFKNLT